MEEFIIDELPEDSDLLIRVDGDTINIFRRDGDYKYTIRLFTASVADHNRRIVVDDWWGWGD